MLPEKIQLQVVTPARQVLRESVDSLALPGQDGYLGILPGHAPLITELGIGLLSFHSDAQTKYLTAMGGFAEILPDRVIVLAEISERAEEIDVPRARAALDRARQALAKPDADWNVDTVRLERAMSRLQVAAKGGFSAGGLNQH